MIRGTTQLYGILGDPVKHSLSPLMQNAAFKAVGLDAVYVPFHVRPEQLADAVAGLRSLSVQGANVTIPHKETVCAYLDEIDEEARLIGAVNTVVLRQQKLVGYNTDGIGFISSVRRDLGVEPQGQHVLMLGAGGAARAAIVALARQQVLSIVIANRNVERAQQLVDCYQPHFSDVHFSAIGLTEPELAQVLPEVGLIVNSTSIGLSGESFNMLPWPLVSRRCAIYDMVYAEQGTPLVRQARAQGHPACDGLGMLIAQGEAAFTLWTGRDPGQALKMALDSRR